MSTATIIPTATWGPAEQAANRKAYLLSLLDAEAEQHQAWADSEDQYPDQDYWDALETALDGWADGEIPGDMLHIARAVDRLGDAYAAFNLTGSALPGNSFWKARTEVEDARRREPPKLKPLDKPADLVKQGVTPRQIARIWKLVDDRDTPLVDLVQQELDFPGSVLTAEYIAEVDRLRMAEAGFGLPSERREKPQPIRPEHPASLEELISQRVPLEQILRLKSEQYGRDFPGPVVSLLANAMGIDLPATGAEVLNTAGATDIAQRSGEGVAKVPLPTVAVLEERELPAADSRTEETGEEQPVEEQVMELFTLGHDAKAIAGHTGLPKKKVEQIIREFDGGGAEG